MRSVGCRSTVTELKCSASRSLSVGAWFVMRGSFSVRSVWWSSGRGVGSGDASCRGSRGRFRLVGAEQPGLERLHLRESDQPLPLLPREHPVPETLGATLAGEDLH